jgi:hypothetical protein
MAVSPFTKSRYRTIFIILAAILVIASGAGGTILLLRQFAPARMTDTVSETTQPDSSSLKKAEDLFAKGDYAGAKTQYQGVLETYKSQKNEAGVKDIEMQLKVLDATANAEQAPQNTDKGRITVGSKPE